MSTASKRIHGFGAVIIAAAAAITGVWSALDVKPASAYSGTLYQGLSMSHGGLTRNYHLYVPQGLPASAAPLVLILHGGRSNYDEFLGLTGVKAPFKIWLEVADLNKFIVAVPNATACVGGSAGEMCWHDCRSDALDNPHNVDDAGFLIALVDQIDTSYNIDLTRVYSTGISNGGHMSLRLALEKSDRIAAIGVVAAADSAASECPANPANPIAIGIMNGTADPILPWEGGVMPDGRGIVKSAYETIDHYVTFNGADAMPEIYDFPDGPYSDSSSVIRETHDNGTQGTEVILFKVNGGGHAEPSFLEQYSALWELIVGRQNHDIEMAEEYWPFFNRHGLSGTISPDPPNLYRPDSFTALSGSWLDGVNIMQAYDDNQYLKIGTVVSPSVSDTFKVGQTSLTKLRVFVRSKDSRSSGNTRKLYLWNYSTSQWVQIGSNSVGTSESNLEVTLTSGLSSYLSNGQVKVKIEHYRSSQTHNMFLEQVRLGVNEP